MSHKLLMGFYCFFFSKNKRETKDGRKKGQKKKERRKGKARQAKERKRAKIFWGPFLHM